jgi:XTP/dITP diphosphohydrolase
MKRNWPFPYIIIATGNRNKLEQFRELFLEHLHLDVKGLKDFQDLPGIVEDQDTFEGNAVKKAETISRHLNAPVVSDDSGLVVPALNGEPGVYSARYAGENATDEENNQKLLKQMESIPQKKRQAYYVCVMALAVPGEPTKTVEGTCHGEITREPRGDQGFGYDPLFYVPSLHKTMAELSNQEKFAISHRGKATRLLIEEMKNMYHFS